MEMTFSIQNSFNIHNNDYGLHKDYKRYIRRQKKGVISGNYRKRMTELLELDG